MFKFSNKSNDKTGQEFYRLANELYPYAQQQLGFDKPVSCVLLSDPQNAQDPLGYTAYYNPEKSEITVYSDGRHVKDMLRSFAHELVHHAQACRGDLDSANTDEGYAQKDDHMREMEREAYEKGNLIFRDWEDGFKKSLNESSMPTMKSHKNLMQKKYAGLIFKSFKGHKFVGLVMVDPELSGFMNSNGEEIGDIPSDIFLEPIPVELVPKSFDEFLSDYEIIYPYSLEETFAIPELSFLYEKKGNFQRWTHGGAEHSSIGPSWKNNSEENWSQFGKRHREDGPAVVTPGRKEYYIWGERHRDDGPAYIENVDSHFPEYWKASWYQNGELHREDGPATYLFKKNTKEHANEKWYLNGKEVEPFKTIKEEFGKDDYTGSSRGQKNVTYYTSKKMDKNTEKHHQMDVLAHNDVYDNKTVPYYARFEESLKEGIFNKKLEFEKLLKILFGNSNLIYLLDVERGNENSVSKMYNKLSVTQGLDIISTYQKFGKYYVAVPHWNDEVTIQKLSKFLSKEEIKELISIINKSVQKSYENLDNYIKNGPDKKAHLIGYYKIEKNKLWDYIIATDINLIYTYSDFLKIFKINLEKSDFWLNHHDSDKLYLNKFKPIKKGNILYLQPKDEDMTLAVDLQNKIIKALIFEPEFNDKIPFYWTGETWSIRPTNAEKMTIEKIYDTISNWKNNHLLIPSVKDIERFPLEENYQPSPISDEFKQDILSSLNLENPQDSKKNWIGTADWGDGEISYFWVQRNNLFYLVEFSPTYGVDIKTVHSTWYDVNSAGLSQLRRHKGDAKVVTIHDKRR